MNTHLPERASYTLNEMKACWQVKSEDMRQWLMNGILSAHVWLPVMSVFQVDEQLAGNSRKHIKTIRHWEGHVPVSRHSCYRLFRCERIYMREFTCADHRESFCLPDTADDLSVSLGDLVILRDERVRFEAEHRVGMPSPDQANESKHSIQGFDPTFKTLRYAGCDYVFGDMQSTILRQLYEAAQTDTPWCSGKRLLADAGSRSFSLSNIFKRNPIWRKIILSDGRGAYRINDEFMTSKK